jgi:transposase InsO family protein
MKKMWVPHDTRDEVMDFVNKWSEDTNIKRSSFIKWLGITTSKFYSWQDRYGKVNEHNGRIPRDFWLEDWEKEAIIEFYKENRTEGYRRLAFMMLDKDIVAVSPTSVWRVLNKAGLLRRWNTKSSDKGEGFKQPLKLHEHWHVDVSHINICGTFYYLCSILDGYSRYIVHWDIRESMTEKDIEIIIEKGREKYSEAKPRIITDNGPQFIAGDFKEYIRLCGMTHVRTSPYYPQSNGKIEAWHKSIKRECIRPGTPLSIEDGKRLAGNFVEYYNNERLHSAIEYIAPKDKLEGREEEIFAERDRKLEAAREARRLRRHAVGCNKFQKDGISAAVVIH